MHIIPLGVRTWTYEQGGYKVFLMYKVETPLMTVEMQVGVHSSESPSRQWYVMRDQTGLLSDRNPELTPLGQSFVALDSEGRSFAQTWLTRLSQGDVDAAFFETQPKGERFRLRKARLTRAPATRPGVPPAFWRRPMNRPTPATIAPA